MIMGVYPGLRFVGVALLATDKGFVGTATIQLGGDGAVDPQEGLVGGLIRLAAAELEGEGYVDLMACESGYVRSGPRRGVELARVAGAAHAVAVVLGVDFVEITPAGARMTLTGDGLASDAQVLDAACEVSGGGPLSIHEAYALGVALAAWEVTYLDEGEGE